jgi:hypothetical protein
MSISSQSICVDIILKTHQNKDNLVPVEMTKDKLIIITKLLKSYLCSLLSCKVKSSKMLNGCSELATYSKFRHSVKRSYMMGHVKAKNMPRLHYEC